MDIEMFGHLVTRLGREDFDFDIPCPCVLSGRRYKRHWVGGGNAEMVTWNWPGVFTFPLGIFLQFIPGSLFWVTSFYIILNIASNDQ